MSEEMENTSEEYEEICSEEVDRVVEALEELTDTISSENIRTYLEDVTNTIYTLVYDEEASSDDEEEMEMEDDVEMEIDDEYEEDMMEEAA